MARFGTAVGSLNEAVGVAMDVANSMNQKTAASVTTSAPTLTAAQIIGGLITLSGQTTAQAVTTDTATAILALIPNAQVGQTFELIIQNGHTSSGTATLTAGTGVTVTNTYATAAQPITTTRQYRGLITNVATPAITFYPVGQVA
jgi:hypothetical protein